MDIKKKIMRRVYAIWFVKKIAPLLFLVPFLTLIGLRETAREFFVAQIIENFSRAFQVGFRATIDLTTASLVNAPVLPILIILFSLGLAGLLAYRLIRNFKEAQLVRSY